MSIIMSASKKLSPANNEFGFDLFRSAIKNSPSSENIFISPFSMGCALTMLAMGASGKSLAELKKALHWDDIGDNSSRNKEDDTISIYSQVIEKLNSEKDIKLLVGNSIWSKSLKESYVAKVREQLNAGAFPLNTEDEINQWISEQTQGMINELIKEIDPTSIGMIFNAIYFKGSWKTPFDSKATKCRPFNRSGGVCQGVQTMTAHEKEFAYKITEEYSVVEFPYEGDKYSMVAVIPHKTSAQLFSIRLNDSSFSAVVSGLCRDKIDLMIPKFTLEYGPVEMGSILKRLGISQVYSVGNAGLDRLSNAASGCVSSIVHNAVCVVNEEGTEASAVASVDSCQESARHIDQIHFDSPFLFVIQERSSGMILFMGIVEDPQHC